MSEEMDTVNEIIESEFDDCKDHEYQSSHICPCCHAGSLVIKDTFTQWGAWYQECPNCGWCSYVQY